MAALKKRGRRRTVIETRQSMRKTNPEHPSYEDMIEDALLDYADVGFTRNAILKYIFKKYGALDKKTIMLKINAAIRDGVENGDLQKLSGTGMSGTFRHIETRTKPSSKDSKRKYPRGKSSSNSRIHAPLKTEKAKVTKAPVKDTKKVYDLRKRNQMTTNRARQSFKTRKSTDSKMRRDAAKKKMNEQLTTRTGRNAISLKVSTTDPNDPSTPLSQESDSKASTTGFSVADTSELKPILSEAPNLKAAPFVVSTMDKTINQDKTFSDASGSHNVSVMNTTDPKSTSSKLHFDTLDSPQSSVPERMSASRAWPFMGIQLKRSVLIELNPGLYGGGMVVLANGRMLIADEVAIRLFETNMNPLSFMAFTAKDDFVGSKRIQDIAIFSETVAIVLLYAMVCELQFIDISTEALSLSQSVLINQDFNPRRITACRDYIYFTSNDSSKPSLVTKMDKSGKVYWSVSNTKQGEQLRNPGFCIESFVIDDSVRLVVSGIGSDACISVLDGESGDILFFLPGQNCLFGLTTDVFNNIYIVNSLGWISVMTSDLSEERIILTTPIFAAKYPNAYAHDLDFGAKRIAFDHKSNSLVVFGGPISDKAVVQIYQIG